MPSMPAPVRTLTRDRDRRRSSRPSLLAPTSPVAAADAARAVEGAADWLHVDVMDNHFVPNLTIGLPDGAEPARGDQRCRSTAT